MNQYSGNLRLFLDSVYQKLNTSWDVQDSQVARDIEDYEKAIFFMAEVFGGQYVGRKWTTSGFEPRLNRAVLDVQSYYFSDASIRERALQKPDDVVEAFKRLCTERNEFRFAIESTTKSISATFTRFKLWSEVLAEVLQMPVSVPQMDGDNRIMMSTQY